MRALEFWKAVTVDRSNLFESLIALLADHRIRHCVIGGQAVNAIPSAAAASEGRTLWTSQG